MKALIAAAALGLLALDPVGAARAQDGWADEDENEEFVQDEAEEGDAEEGWDDDQDGMDEAEEEQETDDSGPSKPGAWSVGARGRVLWVPGFILRLFLDEAPTVTNGSFEALVNYNTGDVTWEFGLGYTGYGFSDPFLARGDPVQDTEYLESSLGMVHLTGSMLWTARFHDMLAFQYGLGLEFGIVTGTLIRSEGYPSGDGYAPCVGVFNPNPTYCEPTQNGQATDPYDAEGAHYGVEEEGIPPVMVIPVLPRLALMFEPIDELAFKLEFTPIPLPNIWIGFSAFYRFPEG